jgi:hypothetical protein
LNLRNLKNIIYSDHTSVPYSNAKSTLCRLMSLSKIYYTNVNPAKQFSTECINPSISQTTNNTNGGWLLTNASDLKSFTTMDGQQFQLL